MTTSSPRARRQRLLERLEALEQQIDAAEHRRHDPVSLVWRYELKEDAELAALVAACVAYGRVALVRDAGERIMGPLGPHPADTLLGLSAADLSDIYHGYVYRMTRGEDVVDLLWGARSMIRQYGSLQASYGAQPGQTHLERASAWVRALRERRLRGELERGLKYLLTDPLQGSAAKRMHLFFRWMGRGPDAIDPGLWETLDPSELLMPLDTHTSRMCRYLGLTSRATADLKAALEVTESLRELDAADPLRFDFPLCHLGISRGCVHRRSEEHCPRCALDGLCSLSLTAEGV